MTLLQPLRLFMTVEGIEASGKSTLIAGLARGLEGGGLDVFTTREPGGTSLGDAIRQTFLDRSMDISPLAEAMLVNAARAQHVDEVIRPALTSGRIVLSDRFVDSTLAYQGYGRGLDLNVLNDLCKIATSGLKPDLVIVLDIPWQVARQRLRDRGAPADRLESEDDAFHERVRKGFLALAKTPNHVIVDATLSSDEVLERAFEVVRSLMVERTS